MMLPANEYVDIALFALLIVTAIALVRNRDLLAVIVLGGIYSLLSAGLFVVMDSPDVAYTEAAVGAGIATVLMIVAMSLVGREERPPAHSRLLPLIVVLATGATLMYGLYDVPPFGAPDNPVQEHVTPHYLYEQEEEIGVYNLVTAVLASYRGYDTMGETVVVFAAGLGVVLLLGGRRARRASAGPEEPSPRSGAGDGGGPA